MRWVASLYNIAFGDFAGVLGGTVAERSIFVIDAVEILRFSLDIEDLRRQVNTDKRLPRYKSAWD